MSKTEITPDEQTYRIVEEVPGVPASERYFVTGPKFSYPYPKFRTSLEAASFLTGQGIFNFKHEPFEL